MLLLPEFIAKGMAGVNFCARAMLIDEVDKLGQKITEIKHK